MSVVRENPTTIMSQPANRRAHVRTVLAVISLLNMSSAETTPVVSSSMLLPALA
jgi:hypothetical protein